MFAAVTVNMFQFTYTGQILEQPININEKFRKI